MANMQHYNFCCTTAGLLGRLRPLQSFIHVKHAFERVQVALGVRKRQSYLLPLPKLISRSYRTLISRQPNEYSKGFCQASASQSGKQCCREKKPLGWKTCVRQAPCPSPRLCFSIQTFAVVHGARSAAVPAPSTATPQDSTATAELLDGGWASWARGLQVGKDPRTVVPPEGAGDSSSLSAATGWD